MTDPHRCTCKTHVQPGDNLDRLTRDVATRLVRYCAANGCAQSEALDRLERGGAPPAPPPPRPAAQIASLSARAANLGRSRSTVVAARVTDKQAGEIAMMASGLKITRGELIRRALVALAEGKPYSDPKTILGELVACLDLPPTATPADVLASVEALVAKLEADLTARTRLSADMIGTPRPATTPAPSPDGGAVMPGDAGGKISVNLPGFGLVEMTEAEFREQVLTTPQQRATWDRQVADRARRADEQRRAKEAQAKIADRNGWKKRSDGMVR